MQISVIKYELERMKTLIKTHERVGKDMVENYLQDLRVKREELENLKSENSQFLQDNNVVEIIKEREERKAMIGKASTNCNSSITIPDTTSLKGSYK